MKLRVFCLLAVLAVIMGLAGCGAQRDVSEEESLYDLIIEDSEETSQTETSAETEEVTEQSAGSETETVTETAVESSEAAETEYVEYWFRTKKLRDQHYEKHGIEMGFDNADDYRRAASDVVNDPDALHKTEKEDGDDVYYLEETNEFVVVSKDGFLRTYFKPDKGKAYFDKQ